MFGKRNLLREGAEPQAVVMAVRDGGVLTGAAGVPIHQYLDLRSASMTGRMASSPAGEPVPAQFQVSADPARIEQMKAKLMQMAAENPGSVVRPSAAGPTSGVSDPIERLAKLADLYGRGALTDAEFAAEKAKILKNS